MYRGGWAGGSVCLTCTSSINIIHFFLYCFSEGYSFDPQIRGLETRASPDVQPLYTSVGDRNSRRTSRLVLSSLRTLSLMVLMKHAYKYTFKWLDA